MFENYIDTCLCMQYMWVSSVYGFYFNDLMTDPFLKVDNSKIKTQGAGYRAEERHAACGIWRAVRGKVQGAGYRA